VNFPCGSMTETNGCSTPVLAHGVASPPPVTPHVALSLPAPHYATALHLAFTGADIVPLLVIGVLAALAGWRLIRGWRW
jgi:hypothetical protein